MQQDLFTPKGRTIVLEITGTIPSYKNNKMLIQPSLREVWAAVKRGNISQIAAALTAYAKKRPMLITKPEYQKQMEQIMASLESQLLSAFQTTGAQTCQGNSIRSLIAASVFADDAWTYLPEIHLRGELCEPGQEGATITIEPL